MSSSLARLASVFPVDSFSILSFAALLAACGGVTPSSGESRVDSAPPVTA
jgi:hypothetical protein